MNNGIVQHRPQIPLLPVAETEVDGIQMGVLSDGTAYLTARGLARMCGTPHSVLSRLASGWQEERFKPRGRRIDEALASQGYSADSISLRHVRNGVEELAFPDVVCMAILEYYAFDADNESRVTALANFRLLARSSFRLFIYNRCGYDPAKAIPQPWKTYHERILLNDQVPLGFFSVFREIADVVVHMIQANCPIDSHTMPDGSVGLAWSKHWVAVDGDSAFGVRQKHPHVFPDWFPQSAVNPVEAWIYPLAALGAFRVWLYESYLPVAFPKYIQGKVKSGTFLPSGAELLLTAVKRGALPKPE